MLKKICVLTASSLLFAASLLAQSVPSATSGARSIVVGAEFSTFNPDWGCSNASVFTCWGNQVVGVGAFVDANHVLWRIGAEGEARWLHWGGPGGGLVQSNYLIGPRYPLIYHPKLALYAKGLVGESWMTIPLGYGSNRYFTLAPGITVEYRVTRKLIVRGEYEYQFWPQFSGISGLPNNGLTPNGLSFGVGYRL
jgi:hypothetical protein